VDSSRLLSVLSDVSRAIEIKMAAIRKPEVVVPHREIPVKIANVGQVCIDRVTDHVQHGRKRWGIALESRTGESVQLLLFHFRFPVAASGLPRSAQSLAMAGNVCSQCRQYHIQVGHAENRGRG